MHRQRLLCLQLLLVAFFRLSVFAQAHPPKVTPGEADATRRANRWLARMTLEEKIGQLVLFTSPEVTTGARSTAAAVLEDQIRRGRCGNVFNVISPARVRRLQEIAVNESRLHIPLLLGFDVIHGFKTIFPIPLGSSASWDLAAIERADRVAATEASAAGLNWTFAPMVDIARDPRWGRIAEGAGEDTWLGSEIARAEVRGFQGRGLADPASLLACAKHFAAYGAAQAGRDYHSVDLSERTLREVYLPPFKAAIDAGTLSLMTAFADVNGTPASANAFLLQEVLRKEWGFQGFVVSDYSSINELVPHGVAANEYEAGRAAFNAGVDMDLQGAVYLDQLQTLLRNGDVKERQIDDAVRRVLRVKFLLGLFDDPFGRMNADRAATLDNYPAGHLAAAYQLASESLVLLKNADHALPLRPGASLAVVGPLADSRGDLLGSWAGAGDSTRAQTILAALKESNHDGKITYAHGCGVTGTDRAGFAEALEAVRNADAAVLCLGESAEMSGEAASRTSISLPGVQTELLREVRKLGKPVILVLLNGRPLALQEESTLADALLEAWFPGTEGGRAVADAVLGKTNPSGHLTVTFPRNLGQAPIFYNAKNTGRPVTPANANDKYLSKYLDSPNDPLFPFGFGLSYTHFEYGGLKLDRETLHPGQTLAATVKVTNTGDRDGVATVQLYLRQPVASVTRPVKELKGFQRVELKAGESRDVTFHLTDRDLVFLRADMTWGTEPGAFQVMAGPNSRDVSTAGFTLLKR